MQGAPFFVRVTQFRFEDIDYNSLLLQAGFIQGGRHLTAFVILQLMSLKPSPCASEFFLFEKPCLNNVSYKIIPAWSPVKGLPVLLAPCKPGAKPTIKSLTSFAPKAGTGLQSN